MKKWGKNKKIIILIVGEHDFPNHVIYIFQATHATELFTTATLSSQLSTVYNILILFFNWAPDLLV